MFLRPVMAVRASHQWETHAFVLFSDFGVTWCFWAITFVPDMLELNQELYRRG